jgi:predicted RNA-binding Zn ribbon-like protein
MRLAKKYSVPGQIALLYEFVNSLDLRSFIEQGAQHATGDELAAPARLEEWMRERGLLTKWERVSAADHLRTLELRESLRSFLQVPPKRRPGNPRAATRLTKASSSYPLALSVSNTGTVTLQPAPGTNAIGRIIAELFALADTGRLDRLKMCASDECHWVFYDRSKPGNRRWCSSVLCGNRHKTRAYRDRRRNGALSR